MHFLVFSRNNILENLNFSKTTWNIEKRLEVARVNTSNIVFITLLDHQATHIYKYMGQNIPNNLGFFGLKKGCKRYFTTWQAKLWYRNIGGGLLKCIGNKNKQ